MRAGGVDSTPPENWYPVVRTIVEISGDEMTPAGVKSKSTPIAEGAGQSASQSKRTTWFIGGVIGAVGFMRNGAMQPMVM